MSCWLVAAAVSACVWAPVVERVSTVGTPGGAVTVRGAVVALHSVIFVPLALLCASMHSLAAMAGVSLAAATGRMQPGWGGCLRKHSLWRLVR